MKAIEVKNLTKTYKQKLKKIKALNGMTFDVEQGQICGFLGPNGAGKSTTLKIIMNFIKSDGGDVLINGVSPDKIESRMNIGFMPENPPYIDSLTGKELLLLSAKMHKISAQKAKERADELLDMLDLTESANKKIRHYSKGMIQRIGFAASLIIEPKILILDEPMSGLDPIGRFKFKDIIKDVQKSGTTVFFSSHIIADIEDVCDKVIIVNKGSVVKTVDEHTMKIFSLEGYELILPKDAKLENYQCSILKNGLKSIKIEKSKLDKSIIDIKNKNINIIAVEPIKKDLEKVFMEIVQ
jgi:ABC-2 type transport system ATP-binding protein